MKGILYVVDCLREDAFPAWFFKQHKGSFGRFETALNTPLSFNSIFLGRNLLGEIPITEKNMYRLYLEKPAEETLWTKLHTREVHTYFVSDLPLMNRAWWKDQVEQMHVSEISSLVAGSNPAPNINPNNLEEPWFILYHSFRAHCLQGRFALKAERRERHHEYSETVEKIFLEEIEKSLHQLKPDVYVVMGDHGEEFWDEEPGELMYGHGTFKYPLSMSENVRYTGFFANEGIESLPTSYEELHNLILSWFSP